MWSLPLNKLLHLHVLLLYSCCKGCLESSVCNAYTHLQWLSSLLLPSTSKQWCSYEIRASRQIFHTFSFSLSPHQMPARKINICWTTKNVIKLSSGYVRPILLEIKFLTAVIFIQIIFYWKMELLWSLWPCRLCLPHLCVALCLQCFDAVGWAAGRASGL